MHSRYPPWLILLSILPLLAGIVGHDLWTPDEPREAEIALEMAEGKSPLVPTLAGAPFVEKPPLYYWISALSLKTLGRLIGMTAAARAVSALAGLLTLLILYLAAGETLGKPRGLAAALVLASLYGFFYASHWILMDGLLMFFIAAAVLLLHDGLERDRPLCLASAGLFGGLAFLTKGPIAFVLIAPFWAALLFSGRAARRRRPIALIAGFLLLVGPALAWMAAYRAAGGEELWREWWVQNQFGRLAGKAGGHERGILYYFGALPYVILPWTFAFLGWIVHRRMRKMPEAGPERRLLIAAAAGALGGFILLSIPGSKRETYLFPLLPAFALLVVRAMEDPLPWVKWSLRVFSILLIAVLAAFAFLTPVWTAGRLSVAGGFRWAALAGGLAAALSYLRFRRDSLAQTASVAACFYLTAAVAGFPLIDRYKSYGPAVSELADAIPPEAAGRVCIFLSDETNLAMFSWYRGLQLEDVRGVERLGRILTGEDERYSWVISAGRNFPPPDFTLPSFRIVKEVTMGRRRSLLLVTGSVEPLIP
jgi:4-amino-4-deoxy-L-arabinose transferase-like glycosyltransferase